MVDDMIDWKFQVLTFEMQDMIREGTSWSEARHGNQRQKSINSHTHMQGEQLRQKDTPTQLFYLLICATAFGKNSASYNRRFRISMPDHYGYMTNGGKKMNPRGE
ncbi:hypothetical protein C4D60_Mb05t24690 [Musa balbisiana]|uniref:Uncharacterized protein n=1 Tax=Musa balbisiana TaxID=52838 RepID=A0A4S8JYL4_MUSBA|nr:hypothetical protein C4D60_Mb05t24690 [Musa balbisiana]